MDKNQAIKQVRGIGTVYFGKKRAPLDVEQLMQRMQEQVLATGVAEMYDWDASREALEDVLLECSDDELSAMLEDFKACRDQVEDCRVFLARINASLREAIETRKRDG